MSETAKTNGCLLIHAVVIRVVQHKAAVTPETLCVKDTVVKVREDSKFFSSSPKMPGRVIGTKDEDPGYVYVMFPNGSKYRYRIGLSSIDNGACDLELDQVGAERFAVMIYGNQVVELPLPFPDVNPGDVVKLSSDPLRIVSFESGVSSGAIAFISQKIDEHNVIVDMPGGRRTVSLGRFAANDIEESGRVVLDSSLSVIINNLGLDDQAFSVSEASMPTWADVFGQDEARGRLEEALEGLAKWPELYKFFKKRTPAGFLLYGPPGCGKTMLGKAAYSSYAAACKEKGIPLSSGFILVSGPEILDKYVGVAEAAIRHIFARARKFYAKYGIPALIFIDECEAIARKRGSGISSDIMDTIVPALLAETDGIRKSGCILMMATNKPEMLDPAFREGRIDVKVEVKRPNREAAGEIFRRNLEGVGISSGTTLEKVAGTGVSELFSDRYVIYTITRSDNSVTHFTLANIVSGAMIVSGIVEEAKRIAIEREKSKKEAPYEGVRDEDMVSAVKSIHTQNLAFDHVEALGDFTEAFRDKITSVEKQRQAQA